MKFRSVLCFLLSLLMIGAMSTAVFADGILYGDADQDGSVGASDLTALARHVAQIDEPLTGKALAACLLCGNSTAGADDLTLLARFVAQIIDNITPPNAGLVTTDRSPDGNSSMVISYNDLL